MFKSKPHTVFLILLILSMVIWGGAWPAGKILAAYGSVSDVLFSRFVFVALSMVPFLLLLKIDFKIQKEGWLYLVCASILMALYSFLFLKGLKNGLAGAGGVLVTTLNPIFAYSIGLVLQKRWPNKTETIGLTLGLIAGCVLLQIGQKIDLVFSSGNSYFLAAAFVWAAMSKFTSKATNYGNSMSFSLWIYILTVLILACSVDFEATFEMWIDADWSFWILLFYTSVIGTTLATSVYFLATTKLGAEQASTFIFIVPLSAAISSWMFLDERIQTHTIIGGIVGIVAVIVLNSKFNSSSIEGKEL